MTKWGLSIQDGRSHAVNEGAQRPGGAYLALCGHGLSNETLLCTRPHHSLCEQCAAHHYHHQHARATVNHRDQGQLAATHWALAEVVALADEADRLSYPQLRDRLRALAEQARKDTLPGRPPNPEQACHTCHQAVD